MRHIVAIAKRELRSYFVSPIAYVALTAFALLSGYFFNSMVVYYVRQASLADRQVEQLGRSALQLDVPTVILEQFFRNQGSFVLLLILPLLTMGLITDERRKGTLELLLTSPVRPIELTLGEKTGRMSKALEDVRRYFDGEVDRTIKRSITLFGPIMLVVLAGTFVLMALAFYLPLFQMLRGIQ